MIKPCRLEFSNSARATAWKLLAKFDAANADDVDDILNSAAGLAGAVLSATGKRLALRVTSDETPPAELMRHDQVKGWKPVGTEEPAR